MWLVWLTTTLGSQPVEAPSATFAELYDRASLVVVARHVGRRSGELCVGDPCEPVPGSWNELAVAEVLKGDPAISTVRFRRIGSSARGQDALYFLDEGDGGLSYMVEPNALSVLRSDAWGNLITDDGTPLRIEGDELIAAPDVRRALDASGRRFVPVESPDATAPTAPPDLPPSATWTQALERLRALRH